MTATIDRNFESTILIPADTRSSSRTSAKSRRRDKAAAVAAAQPSTPPSLWRSSLNEEHESRAHRLGVKVFCVLSAVLGAGSIGYAAWRLCTLLSDDRLHDAVAAFAR